MPFFQHDNISFYYEMHGEGIPILFIPPPAMGHVTFKKQLPLANDFCVITIDLRGNGRSQLGSEPLSIPLLASDVAALLNHLEINDIILCGYSNGGSIALHLAIYYPKIVKGLILLAGFPEVNTFLLSKEFTLGIKIAKIMGTSFLGKIFGISHTNEPVFQKQIERYTRLTNPMVLAEMYEVGLSYNCRPHLHNISCPALLIVGTKDIIFKPYQQIFLQHINDCSLAFVDQARHQLPTKFAHEVNTIIHGFIRTLLEKTKNDGDFSESY